MHTTSRNNPTPLVSTARQFSALGDADRLRLLALIAAGGEVCNCQLEKVTGYLPSKISRHLGQLKGAGWIDGRRHGTWIYYSLNQTTRDGWLRPLLRQIAESDDSMKDQVLEIRQRCERSQSESAAPDTLAAHLL